MPTDAALVQSQSVRAPSTYLGYADDPYVESCLNRTIVLLYYCTTDREVYGVLVPLAHPAIACFRPGARR